MYNFCDIILSEKKEIPPRRNEGREVKEMITRTWKVYGTEGHRQRESFFPSKHWDFSEGEDVRKINVYNADTTGTNEYAVVEITRNTAEECERELFGQLDDGIFEDSKHGKIEEVTEG